MWDISSVDQIIMVGIQLPNLAAGSYLQMIASTRQGLLEAYIMIIARIMMVHTMY